MKGGGSRFPPSTSGPWFACRPTRSGARWPYPSSSGSSVVVILGAFPTVSWRGSFRSRKTPDFGGGLRDCLGPGGAPRRIGEGFEAVPDSSSAALVGQARWGAARDRMPSVPCGLVRGHLGSSFGHHGLCALGLCPCYLRRQSGGAAARDQLVAPCLGGGSAGGARPAIGFLFSAPAPLRCLAAAPRRLLYTCFLGMAVPVFAKFHFGAGVSP